MLRFGIFVLAVSLVLFLALPLFPQSPERQDHTKPVVWKVWYDDGSGLKIFHSAVLKWDDIPTAPGIQVVLVCEDKEWAPGKPYRRLMRGSDWYGWRDGELQLEETSGLPNGKWIVQPRDFSRPRRGLTIQTGTFESYVAQAQEDAICSVP